MNALEEKRNVISCVLTLREAMSANAILDSFLMEMGIRAKVLE